MKKSSMLMFTFLVVTVFSFQAVSAQITINIPKIPKIKKDKPVETQQNTSTNTDSGGTPEDVQTNPEAPADYNANLNVNDTAVAVDHFRLVEAVKIIGKSGTSYKVAKIKSPDSVRWYNANSVYPFFDNSAFNDTMYDYKRYVAPYLPCYAKKHNLDEVKVTDMGYMPRNYSNAQDAQRSLQAEQPKLAELQNLLNQKLGGSAPNTFLPYLENPAVVAEITAGRAEYLNCVVGTEDDKPDFRLAIFLDDIKKAQGEVDRYSPKDFLYLVSDGASSEELLRAVSPKAREEWAKQWLKNPSSRTQFNTAWDNLAAAAAKKIPTYKPSATNFQFRYPVGEKLLMNEFKNTSTLKIFRIGADTAGWDIQKDNNDLLPSYHYKTLRVYLRDTSDDHPYCQVVSARVKQDYAGGGTYSTEVYRSSASEELVGCPAGN